MATRIITTAQFADALKSAGLLPDNCRRVVIDAEAGKVVRVHYETFADERILQVITSVAGVTVVTGPPPEPKFLTDSELQRGMDHLVQRQKS